MELLAALLLMLTVAGAIGTVTGFGIGATLFSLVILIGGGIGLVMLILWWVYADARGDSSQTHASNQRLQKAQQRDDYAQGVIEETTYHDQHE